MTSREVIHAGFSKWQIPELGGALHLFNGPEGGDPHSHFWSFKTHCLRGWYKAVSYWIGPSGYLTPTPAYFVRAGETRYFDAEHIHQIVETAPEGCLTWCEYGQPEREALFYRNGPDGKVQTRRGHESWSAVA